jgi:effector-binding domain-containing protein
MMMLSVSTEAEGTPKMYPKTPAGVIEIKTIPASRLMVTEAEGSYFDHSNELFYRLFNYIKGHEVSMTAPVEGSLDEEARMAFYVGPQVGDRELSDEGSVHVLTLPERSVAAIGGRGSYREKNVRRYLEKLEAWLTERPEYEIIGPPYAVYWNPPFIPWFLRRLEVHIPVKGAQ